MKPYLVSLALGILVGAIYGLFNVRSPAPPIIALVGLLGILLGEQAMPIMKRWVASEKTDSAWIAQQLKAHSLAQMPCQLADETKTGSERNS